ncbi:TIGR01620 family protein [Sulfurospirillum sp. 1612]|uniref:TIGR01620 family protein n=1 Tax=Sulfurospirillum sp. 1612 TaxID=3094835 RepID=UPI002F943C32
MSIKPFKKIIQPQQPDDFKEPPIKPFKMEPTGALDTHMENVEDATGAYDAKNRSSFEKFFASFRTIWGIGIALLFFIVVMIVSDTIQSIQDIMIEGSVAQYLYLVGLLVLLLALILNLFSTVKQLKTLQRVTDIQAQFERQKKQPTQEIVGLVHHLLRRYEHNPDPKLQQHITQIRTALDSAVVYHELYHDIDGGLLSILDEHAKKRIHKASLQAALSTAISPIPLFDMLLIFWRSLLLTKEIALVYGFCPGGLTRLILLKKAVVHIAFAGVAELAADLANQVTGASMLTKFSESIGQGIANGVLLSRLGYGIMDACRPIALGEKKSSFARELLKDIAQYFKIYTPHEPI